jgi:hypothetical protein
LALLVLRSSAAFTAFALMLDWPLAGGVIGAIGIVNAGVMGWQLIGFGKLMHRIIEAVAKQAQLLPIEPKARARLEKRGWARGSAGKTVPLQATPHGSASTESPLARG